MTVPDPRKDIFTEAAYRDRFPRELEWVGHLTSEMIEKAMLSMWAYPQPQPLIVSPEDYRILTGRYPGAASHIESAPLVSRRGPRTVGVSPAPTPETDDSDADRPDSDEEMSELR